MTPSSQSAVIWQASLDQASTLCEGSPLPEEVEEASAMKTATLRERLLRRRILSRMLLGGVTGLSPEEVSWMRLPHGKPALSRSDLSFNTSHCGERWWMASAPTSAVGVDVERLRPIPDASALAERFFHPNERRHDLTTPSRFLSIWTAKEAVMKAEGTGLSTPMDQLDTSAVLESSAPLWVDSPSGRQWWVVPVCQGTEWIGALALPEALPLHMLDWPPEG